MNLLSCSRSWKVSWFRLWINSPPPPHPYFLLSLTPLVQITLPSAAIKIKEGGYNFRQENTEHSPAKITPSPILLYRTMMYNRQHLHVENVFYLLWNSARKFTDFSTVCFRKFFGRNREQSPIAFQSLSYERWVYCARPGCSQYTLQHLCFAGFGNQFFSINSDWYELKTFMMYFQQSLKVKFLAKICKSRLLETNLNILI